MTIITVTSQIGCINASARAVLARTLTDAVLVPELGQFVASARAGFQVHFRELASDSMALGGQLVAQCGADVITVDIAVMDGDWAGPDRVEVIRGTLAALAEALGMETPRPEWWVNLRVIDEGSWGSRGAVLSILDLLPFGVFSEGKAAAIRSKFADRD